MSKNNANMNDVIVSCVLGGSLEWYSFAIYGFLATVMGANFFHTTSQFQQAIASLGAFAVGLVSRPVGAILFGYISSVVSQELSFKISIYMMAVATFLIGVLPTYDSIGALSTALLLILRVIQGLSLGGGFTGTMVFLYEHAPADQKNKYTVWSSFCLIFAFILCALTSWIMSCAFSGIELQEYAWRIPFVGSILGIFAARYINEKLTKAKGAQPATKKHQGNVIKELFSKYRRRLVNVILFDVLTGCGFFIIAIFYNTYFQTIINIDAQTTALSQVFAMSVFAAAVMYSGRICDRYDSRMVMIAACAILAVGAYPFFSLSKYGMYGAILGQILVIVAVSMYHGGVPAMLCKSFHAAIRPIGVATSHNLAMALFGAYSPSLAGNLIQLTGDIASPAYLLIVASVLSIFGLYFCKEISHN